MKAVLFVIFAVAGLASQPALAATDGAGLFKKRCSICHKLESKGMGPAVTEMGRDAALLASVIADGSRAMPGFGKQLDGDQIDALVTYILQNNPE